MWRGARSLVVAVALVVAPGALVACSGSDGSDGGSGGSTTTAPDGTSGGPASSTTSGGTGSSTTVVEVPTTPTTEAVAGPTFTGTIGNEDGSAVEISFVRTDGAIRNLTIRGLEVACYSTGVSDDVSSQIVDLVLPVVEVAADGSVEHTEPSNPWQPAVQGRFEDDGRFLGNIFLNLEADGRVCGGDVPLDLAP